MLVKWKLENFKSIYDSTELELSPLTVFAGANSSGKSTFIQSILLVAQTISNQIHTRPVILNGHFMRFGNFDDLASKGSKKDSITISFTYNKEKLTENEIRFPRSRRRYFWGDENVRELECLFSFSPRGITQAKTLTQLQPLLSRSKIITKYFSDKQQDIVEIKRTLEPLNERAESLRLDVNNLSKELLETLDYEVVSPKNYNVPDYLFDGKEIKTKLVGARTIHFMPVQFSFSYDIEEENAKEAINVLTNISESENDIENIDRKYLNSELLSFLKKNVGELIEHQIKTIKTELDSLASEKNKKGGLTIFNTQISRKKNIEKNYRVISNNLNDISDKDPIALNEILRKISSSSYLDLIKSSYDKLVKLSRGEIQPQYNLANVSTQTYGYNLLNNTFTHYFRYLGPLRDEPKAVYPLEGSGDPTDVGLRGEFTAAVLDLHKHEIIEYISPDSFTGYGFNAEVSKTSLMHATQDWLQYMGVVNRLDTQDQGVFGHELKIAPDESSDLYNLLHVGVGVSQILPILVMSLISDPETLLVFEQPELHLHPKVQSRLADFFLSLSLLKKQCIVESHSEYLITRLRLRVAEDQTNKLHNNIGLYYVEKIKRKSKYRKILINEYGAINDWPEGFFDQAPNESEKLIKAAYTKKISEKNKE